MTPLEKDIERYLVRLVKTHGGYCLKWVCPGWSGVPDRIVLLPGGRVIFIEMKRPGGVEAPLQKVWRENLTRLGFTALTLWSHEAVKEFERNYLNEKS